MSRQMYHTYETYEVWITSNVSIRIEYFLSKFACESVLILNLVVFDVEYSILSNGIISKQDD